MIERSHLIFSITAAVILLVGAVVIGSLAMNKYKIQEIQCLALNIYHEARGESQQGKLAVATVTMNRLRSPDYPDNVCSVVYQKGWNGRDKRFIGEFSWTQDEITDIPENDTAWLNALNIARDAYNDRSNKISAKVKDALFYHADYVSPYWARKKIKIAKIGRHIFYK